MNRFSKRSLVYFLLTAFLVTILCLPGCQQQAKKIKPEAPQKPAQRSEVKLSQEVAKYKSEPTISLYRKATGNVEHLKLEDYLKGVVAAEIGPKYPMEALKAQAIVARTMTLALIEYENGTRGKHKTDASDDHTEFQAYDNKAVTDNIAKAVDETRGQVLVSNGKFVYALFHSASKNKTASIEEGFPKLKDKAPYLVPVSTNGLKYAPQKYRSWTVKVPKSEVIRAMGIKTNSLEDIKITKRGPSGRALTIAANKGTIRIAAVDLREKIGFDRLYSTSLSSIKIQGDYVVFKGAGWGHGCGMEQWGAYGMAKQGKKSRDIVQHYFPKARWVQLYK